MLEDVIIPVPVEIPEITEEIVTEQVYFECLMLTIVTFSVRIYYYVRRSHSTW